MVVGLSHKLSRAGLGAGHWDEGISTEIGLELLFDILYCIVLRFERIRWTPGCQFIM